MTEHFLRIGSRLSSWLKQLRRESNRRNSDHVAEPLERRLFLTITQLTNLPTDHRWPATNDNGDLVYCSQVAGLWQVFLNGQQVTNDSHNNKYPAISNNQALVYFKDGGSGGVGWQVVRRSAGGGESQLEFSSRNSFTGAHRDANRYSGIASNGTSISGYNFYNGFGSPTRRLNVAGVGQLAFDFGGDFSSYNYPDINSHGDIVVAGDGFFNSGTIYKTTTSGPFPGTPVASGTMGRINDLGEVVSVTGDLNSSGNIQVTNIASSGQTIQLGSGSWADINDNGEVVFENVDSQGVRQIYRYTPDAIDFSYSSASPSEWNQIATMGYRLAIADLWNGFDTFDNLAGNEPGQLFAANQANLLTAGYVALSFNRPNDPSRTGAAQVDAGINSLGGWNSPIVRALKFIAIDVEPDGQPVIANPIVWVSDAVAEVRRHGLTPIIYTSSSGWQAVMNGSTAFASLALWDAHWSSQTTLDPFPGYGGWTQRFGLQYSHDQTVTGSFNVDLDTFDFSRMNLPPLPNPITGLSETSGNGQVTLNWAVSPGDISYRVYRSTTPGGEGTNPIAFDLLTPSFTDTGLVAGTPYYYQVTSVSATGESQPSAELIVPPSFVVQGLPGGDTFRLSASGGNISVFQSGSIQPAYTFPLSNSFSLTIVSAGGNDKVDLDFSNGSTMPSGGLEIVGGAGIVTISTVGGGAGVLRLHSGNFNLPTNLSGLSLQVDPSVVTISSNETLASLQIAEGSRVYLAAGANVTLSVNKLLIDLSSTLDLADNDLILQSTAANRLADLADIAARIKSGRNGGNWTSKGIISSVAAAEPNKLTGLAIALNDKGNGSTLYSTFDGEPVDTNSILVKYTYNGDADLNGKIDADDYFQIDNGFAQKLAGYRNGDFDFNGVVDADDYFLIDRAFVGQTGILAAQALTPALSRSTGRGSDAAKTLALSHGRGGKHHRRG